MNRAEKLRWAEMLIENPLQLLSHLSHELEENGLRIATTFERAVLEAMARAHPRALKNPRTYGEDLAEACEAEIARRDAVPTADCMRSSQNENMADKARRKVENAQACMRAAQSELQSAQHLLADALGELESEIDNQDSSAAAADCKKGKPRKAESW